MNRILDMYKDIKIKIDLNEFKDVDSDNVCSKLNKAFEGHFSYDAEIIAIAHHLVKVTLYTPLKVTVGYGDINTSYDVMQATKDGLVNACKLAFAVEQSITHKEIEAPIKDVAATTLEELEEIEKEIATSEHHESVKFEKGEPVELKPSPVNTTANPYGIREDQIEFMKKFQERLKIDTTEKFDTYVSAWNGTQSMYVINNKKQLISCGPEAVDAFIAWVKEVYKDNVANNDFVCPTDEQWEECLK